jgi:hypothetical protein
MKLLQFIYGYGCAVDPFDPDPPFETHIPLMSGRLLTATAFFMSITGCPVTL